MSSQLRAGGLAALALTAALGCDRPTLSPERTVLRFIDSPAQELLQPDSLLRVRPIAEWPIADRDELARWTVTGADKVLQANGSVLVLQGARSYVTMEREVELEASSIRYFELTVGRIKGVAVGLDWAPVGGRFSAARQIDIRAHDIPSHSVARVRFPVSDHRLWTGTIGRLRLRYSIPRLRRMTARHFAALDAGVDPDRLTAAVAKPWMVDLEGETRGALLAPPGVPIERSIEIPANARLVVSWAAPEAAGPRVEMRASFVPTETPDSPQGEPIALLARPLDPLRTRGWQNGEADLSELAGQRGLLRLESVAADPSAAKLMRAGATPPVWGNPEVRAAGLEVADPNATGQEAGGHGTEAKPNVVLISIDTLRADRLSLYGHSLATSPTLDAWAARRAVTFETTVAAAPWTLPAHASMFTGLEAFRHGVNFDTAAPPEIETLAERLHGAGYRTLSVNGGGFLHPRFGLAQGFDRTFYFQAERTRDTTELVTGMDRALELVRNQGGAPFFLFFHTYEVHGPLRERAPYFEQLHGYRPTIGVTNSGQKPNRDTGYLADFVLKPISAEPLGERPDESALDGTDLPALARDLYDARIAYTDRQLARLFDELRTLGIERNTIVVVTSDHGEMLGEHGLGGHAFLYDQNLLVPLVISAPGLTDRPAVAGRHVSRQVRQIDIAPTVLELAGIDPGPSLDGRSLVALLRDEPAASSAAPPTDAWSYAPKTLHGVSLRSGGRAKYVQRTGVWPPAGGQGLLFDLRSDPEENAPLLGEHPALRHRVTTTLREAYSGVLLRVLYEDPPPGATKLRADLGGTFFSQAAVQSLDYGCDCLQLRGVDKLALEASGGERFTLRLENAIDEEIQIDAAIRGIGPPGRTSETFDLSTLSQPVALLWEQGRWVRRKLPDASLDGSTSPFADTPGTGFILWRRGPARSATARPSDEDAALREQLKALGYID